MPRINVYSLFPIPVMTVEDVFDVDACNRIIKYYENENIIDDNEISIETSHTRMGALEQSSEYLFITNIVSEHVINFGRLMFGEILNWNIKEVWINKMKRGGFQYLHNHANSFISGVAYLSDIDSSSQTMIHKDPIGNSFVFVNEHEGVQLNQYNASSWRAPNLKQGSLLLFPSYLMHEVPINRGTDRYTIAFNAVPDRLRSGVYDIYFEK